MVRTKCLNCSKTIEIKLEPELAVGRAVSCPSCDTVLDIVWLYPLVLDWHETEPKNPRAEGRKNDPINPDAKGRFHPG